jgi:nucleotide-binding universal stress UspA family protein
MLSVQQERRNAMKILIGIDESTHSERALEFVGRVRWPAGSRALVLSVLRPLGGLVAADFAGSALPVSVEDDQRKTLTALVAKAETSLREVGISTEGNVLVGDPREVLIEVASAERADLLVVGSRGNTGIARLMLGSVSSHVVAHAPCSVLVVKTPRATPGSTKGAKS